MEQWRQCGRWLIDCKVLPPNHRVVWPSAVVFDLAQALRDGVLLCQLLHNLSPGSIDLKDINFRPQMSQVRGGARGGRGDGGARPRRREVDQSPPGPGCAAAARGHRREAARAGVRRPGEGGPAAAAPSPVPPAPGSQPLPGASLGVVSPGLVAWWRDRGGPAGGGPGSRWGAKPSPEGGREREGLADRLPLDRARPLAASGSSPQASAAPSSVAFVVAGACGSRRAGKCLRSRQELLGCPLKGNLAKT